VHLPALCVSENVAQESKMGMRIFIVSEFTRCWCEMWVHSSPLKRCKRGKEGMLRGIFQVPGLAQFIGESLLMRAKKIWMEFRVL